MRHLVFKEGAFNQRLFEVVINLGGSPETQHMAICAYRDRSCSPDCVLCSIGEKNEVRCERAGKTIGKVVII